MMLPAVTVALCDLLVVQVYAGRNTLPPRIHPNVSSGDLLEYSDYSDPITPPSVPLPPYIRHDHKGNVVILFTMHYGDHNKIVDTSTDDLLVTKKRDPKADLAEIWHIHKDDQDLKYFFAKVLGLDPVNVDIVHITFSKTESVKKVLVLKKVMTAAELLAKVKAAEGVID